ncbi:hypothetical protein C8J56DRAFT_1062271 [Mycena floridula]|nr:hypothetical protein C8J56DRAFT_1062271 [Mycena floridula]
MTTETYELLYFPVFLRADVALMALEVTNTKYKLTTVLETWSSIKNEQQFGQLPRLTVSQADGTSQHIWESGAIELYLGEKLGLFPPDLIAKAQSISIVHSLHFLQEQITSTVILQSAELRAAKHEKHMAETIPNHLRWHEALLGKSSGTYYAGDTVSTITLPDLVLVSLFLRYRDMYGTRNPVTKFPNIMKAVNAIITEKLAEYAEERRDARQWKWNSEKFEFINEELERLGLT